MPDESGAWDAGEVSDPADEREDALTRIARGLALRASAVGSGVVPKIAAALVVFVMIFTFPVDSGDHDAVARVAAPPTGPFSRPVLVNDNKVNDQALPVVVATPNQSLFVVWQDMRSGNEDIYSSVSFDNGTTFSPSKRVDDSNGSSKQKDPAATVSSNGTILIVWQDSRRSTVDYDIYMTQSYDGGLSFAKNVKVDDSSGAISWQERPSVTVTRNGAYYVAWTDDRTGYLRVRGAYSTNGGVSFASSAEVAPSMGPNSGQTGVVLTTSGNRIFAAFLDNSSGMQHPYVCTSTNGGKSFSVPIRLDGPGGDTGTQRRVSIAPIPGGGAVAAWEDSRNGHWDVYASVLSSRGMMIASDIKVDDDSTGADQTSPSVVVDQLGNTCVVWSDEMDGSSYAVRFSCMASGNTTFNASMIISDPGNSDLQWAPSVIATQPGGVFVVWQDDKQGDDDVYISHAYFPWLFGLSLDNGWNFISIPTVGFSFNASTLGLKTMDAVISWSSSTQSYSKTYIVGVSPPSADFPLIPGVGYWISTRASERVILKGNFPTGNQSKQLIVPAGGGWASVGFESLNTTRLASDVPRMANATGAIQSVTSFDSATGTYTTYITGVPASDFVLAPGEAIWCSCKASVTLSYVS